MLAIDQIIVLESDLYNHRLQRKSDGKIYNIEKVIVENWTLDGGTGWWIKLLIENDKSHNLLYWQNINCTEPDIVQMCKETRAKYELI